MVLNTTSGPVEVPKGTSDRVINTSELLEPPAMQYLDEEPEIAFVIPANGWAADLKDRTVPLVCWVIMDDTTTYGVTLGRDGRVDVNMSVEERDDFKGYIKT